MANIDPEKISNAPIEEGSMPTVPVGKDPLTRDPIIDQKMGWIGKFFGYGEEKKGNIAGLAFMFSAVMLAVCMATQILASDDEVRAMMASFITPLFGLLTGLLGYATGQKMNSD